MRNSVKDGEIKPTSEALSSNTVPSNATNSSLNTSLAESNMVSKKDIGYIFKLDVTKQKLESINKKIEKLASIALSLTEKIQENDRIYLILESHYYEVSLKHQEMFSSFMESLDLYGYTFVQVTNLSKRDKFLEKIASEEERVAALQELHWLDVSFRNASVQEDLLYSIQKDMTALDKQTAKLSKQFDENKKRLQQETQKFYDTNNAWLLASYEVSNNKVSIDDFVAHPQIETQLKKLITMYTHKHEMIKFWLSLPKGILFVGDTETGKTLAAKVFASEIEHKLYHIKAHDLFSENVDDPNEMLYVIFYSIIDNIQKTKEPCVVFLDEIEKIISSVWEYSPATEKMISNTLIKNIVNIQKSGLDITIIAALTQKNKIDERFLKHDLFDSQFFFNLPEAAERKRLFEIYIQKAEKHAKLKLFASDFLDELVKQTDGFSAKYIKQTVDACVREYSYNYIQNKSSLSLDSAFISTAAKKIQKIRKKSSSEDTIFPNGLKRNKIISFLARHTMKQELIFGELKDSKKIDLIQYIMEITSTYTEDKFNILLKMCVDEYSQKKAGYHKTSLISKEFVLEKINELKSEDRIKWKRVGFF